jgi:hypothetical protein
VTVLEGMKAEVAHSYSVEEKNVADIKNTVDFGWIRFLVLRFTSKI